MPALAEIVADHLSPFARQLASVHDVFRPYSWLARDHPAYSRVYPPQRRLAHHLAHSAKATEVLSSLANYVAGPSGLNTLLRAAKRVDPKASIESVRQAAGEFQQRLASEASQAIRDYHHTGREPLARMRHILEPEPRRLAMPMRSREYATDVRKYAGERGLPEFVYHGTNVDFPGFDLKHLGYNTFTPSAHLGFHFARTPEEASHYGKKVIRVEMRIKNPKMLTDEELHRANNSVADARALRHELIEAGHDGAFSPIGEWIVFHPESLRIADHQKSPERPIQESRSGGVRRYSSLHAEPAVQDVKVQVQPGVLSHLTGLFGRTPTQTELAHLASATPGAEVHVAQIHPGHISLESKNPETGSYAFRMLSSSSRSGSPVIHNESLDHMGADFGQGLWTFRRQVQTARALGIHHLHVADAIGSPEERYNPNPAVGYYVWPRFGFQGHIPAKWRRRLPANMVARLGLTSTFHDLFALPGGAEAWKERGGPVQDLQFDTALGSPHAKRLEAYTQERLKRRPRS